MEDLASRGGLLYRQAGSPESAAQMLVKAAKIVERETPERAVSLYEKAADTVRKLASSSIGHVSTSLSSLDKFILRETLKC